MSFALLLVATATVSVDSTEEVVVTGARLESKLADSPVAVEVIDRKQIDESGAESLTDILQDAPGVQVTHSLGRAGVLLEGLDPQYTLILVDGQRQIGRVEGVLDLNRFPAERIERVEIVKGAASALYGADALAGVINIITRRSKKPFEGEAHASFGSFKLVDGTAVVGSSGDNYNLRVSGGFHRGDTYRIKSAERRDDNPSTSGPGFNEGSGDVRADYDLNELDRLTFRADYLFRDATSIAAIEIPQKNPDDPMGEPLILFQTFNQTNRTENYSLSLSETHAFESTSGQLQLTAYYSGWREQFLQDVSGVKGDAPAITYERLGQLTAQHDEPMGEEHMVSIGTELLLEGLEASERICRSLTPGGCTPDNITGETNGESAKGASRARWAAFLQDVWTISESPKLMIVPGIRADVDSLFGTYPTPKLSVRFDPLEEVVLRASYGLGFRAPNFRELYLSFTNLAANYHVTGNPELDPETSRSVNLSVQVKPIDRVRLSVEYYRNDLRNLIDYELLEPPKENELGLYRYENIARAVTQGIESFATYTPIDQLSLSVGYTFLDARNLSADVPLVGRSKHRVQGRLRVEEPWTDTALYANAEWIGKRLYPDIETGETPSAPAYWMIGMRVEKRLGEQLEVFVGADNLANAKDAKYLLVRPRVVYAGLTGRM